MKTINRLISILAIMLILSTTIGMATTPIPVANAAAIITIPAPIVTVTIPAPTPIAGGYYPPWERYVIPGIPSIWDIQVCELTHNNQLKNCGAKTYKAPVTLVTIVKYKNVKMKSCVVSWSLIGSSTYPGQNTLHTVNFQGTIRDTFRITKHGKYSASVGTGHAWVYKYFEIR
jgi:hypothetical protein